MTLQTERLDSVEQIGDFLDGNGEVDFRPLDREEAYGFVRRTLVRLDYDAQGRAGKGTVREFLGKATGLSHAAHDLPHAAHDLPAHAADGGADRRTPPAGARRPARPADSQCR